MLGLMQATAAAATFTAAVLEESAANEDAEGSLLTAVKGGASSSRLSGQDAGPSPGTRTGGFVRAAAAAAANAGSSEEESVVTVASQDGSPNEGGLCTGCLVGWCQATV